MLKSAKIFVVICCMVFAPALNAEDHVRIGIFDFPPFYSKNGSEPAQGFLVDLAKEKLGKINRTPVFKLFHTPLLIDSLVDGSIDLGMLIKHPALIDKTLYSKKPISHIELMAFRGVNMDKVSSWKELAGKRVLLLAGYGYGGLKNKITGLQPAPALFEASNIESGLEMLLAGRADYFLSYLKPSRAIAQRKGYMDQDRWLMADEIAKFDVYWVMSRKIENATELMKQLESIN